MFSNEVVSGCGFMVSGSLAVIVVPTKATDNSLLWISAHAWSKCLPGPSSFPLAMCHVISLYTSGSVSKEYK